MSEVQSNGAQVNWRAAQAEHHASKARLLVAYAAAYYSEASSCGDDRRRRYLQTKARKFRREADLRFEKAAQLSRPAAA
jgi:hypothetical protein